MAFTEAPAARRAEAAGGDCSAGAAHKPLTPHHHPARVPGQAAAGDTTGSCQRETVNVKCRMKPHHRVTTTPSDRSRHRALFRLPR